MTQAARYRLLNRHEIGELKLVPDSTMAIVKQTPE
jgi:hypothetical protein